MLEVADGNRRGMTQRAAGVVTDAQADRVAVGGPVSNTRPLVKVIAYSLLVIICILSAELTCRVFWGFKIPGAFFHPDRAIYYYQKNLLKSGLPDADVRRDDGYYDVLLLGGSVVSHDFGRIDDYLAAGLLASKGPVRVWNAAELAQTSRDSSGEVRSTRRKALRSGRHL